MLGVLSVCACVVCVRSLMLCVLGDVLSMLFLAGGVLLWCETTTPLISLLSTVRQDHRCPYII